MPSRTDTAGHTKAFIYPVMDHWGESRSALAQGRFELLTCRSTVKHTNHQTTPSWRISYTLGPLRGSSPHTQTHTSQFTFLFFFPATYHHTLQFTYIHTHVYIADIYICIPLLVLLAYQWKTGINKYEIL